jgi:YjbE family integral membrane protein
VGELLAYVFSPGFWVGAGQIIGINLILSGDNAVVIALACRMLPPRQRFWGMILGAGVAVLLRVLFTLVVAEAMGYSFLKLVGGVLLLWVAVKLVVPEDGAGEGKIAASESLWRAVRIIAIADIVMSLDNVIAIAAVA